MGSLKTTRTDVAARFSTCNRVGRVVSGSTVRTASAETTPPKVLVRATEKRAPWSAKDTGPKSRNRPIALGMFCPLRRHWKRAGPRGCVWTLKEANEPSTAWGGDGLSGDFRSPKGHAPREQVGGGDGTLVHTIGTAPANGEIIPATAFLHQGFDVIDLPGAEG
jgi:hypothetical protein